MLDEDKIVEQKKGEMTEEQKSLFLSKLVKHSESTNTIINYSIQRIDLLIISVSGAGIYACWEIIKLLNQKYTSIDYTALKITAALFITAIVTNFISQWFGYYANGYEKKSTDKTIHSLENNTYARSEIQAEIAASDKCINLFNNLTKISNAISTGSMCIGLILIGVFTWRIL